jgi:hypothetical protein
MCIPELIATLIRHAEPGKSLLVLIGPIRSAAAKEPGELGKVSKKSHSHARAGSTACGLPRNVLALVRCRSGSASTRTAPREEKTLDARKVDRSRASVPLSGTGRRPVPTIDTHTHFMPVSALGPAMAGDHWHGIQLVRCARGKTTSAVGGISQEISWRRPRCSGELDGRSPKSDAVFGLA